MVLDHPGSATLADNVEFVVGDGATLTVVTAAGLGRRRRARRRAPRAGSAGTPRFKHVVVTLGGDLVRRHRRRCTYAGPGGDAELLGALLRRRRPAPGAPAVRRPRRAALPQQRRRTRARCRAQDAHTVWIGDVLIRADGRGHRHLRAEPQPAAHRRRPRRLGAQPGDRDRRDRRRRPRQRHRPLRRRAAVLPAGPRHPGGRGPPAGGPRLLRRAHRAASASPRSRSG